VFTKSQSALDQYKNKRGAEIAAELTFFGRVRAFPYWRWVRLTTLTLTLAATYFWIQPAPLQPVDLTYEIDLSEAEQGTLTITLIADGNLPKYLDLEFPPGIFGDLENGVTAHNPSGRQLHDDGSSGKPLAIEQTEDGWRLSTQNVSRAGFIYRIDLDRVSGQEQDVRRHISTPVNGGLRAAGFEIFLEPVGMEVQEITVSIYNPLEIPLLVPWPALVKGKDLAVERRRHQARKTGQASLGLGQGFAPGIDLAEPTQVSNPLDAAAPVPSNMLYHPRNLADLNNSLIIDRKSVV